MTTTKILKAKSISQPNAFDNSKKLEKQPSDNLWYRDKGYLKYNCTYWGGTTKKSFRQWNHPKEIINGNKTQCGSADGKKYGSEVQHIGGPTGDIPRPAMLHIHNFDTSFLNSTSSVHKIKISFDWRVVNVTSSGSPWVNNLAKSEHAILQGVQLWFGTWNQNKLFGKIKKDKTDFEYQGKNKKGYIWKSFETTFSDISASDLLNNKCALNIQFGPNCSKAQTPCMLFINNFKIEVEYKSSQKYIEGKNSAKSLYTSPDNGCFTRITQTIEAGYKNGKAKIPVADAPHKLGGQITFKNVPSGVTVEKISSNDLTASFRITDKSGVAGEKQIVYYLQDDSSVKTTMKYTAVKRPRPEFDIIEEYKSFEDFNPDKAYIILKNGCTSDVKIYIDDINSTPLTLSIANQNSTVNLLDETQIQAFHNKIKTLSCGYHTLYIRRGSESIDSAKKNIVTIRILPMEFKFKIYSDTNPNFPLYKQRKKDGNGQTRREVIKIQRIDDEPRAVIPAVHIIDETNISGDVDVLNNFAKGEVKTHVIDKYYAGEFYIKAIEAGNNCVTQNPSGVKIFIESTHKQNYDYLFTRGEDGTAFDFDYLVAWEGDNIKTPIKLQNAVLKNSPNDIRFCCDSSSIGLSQIGIAELIVTNKTNNETFNNVRVELNTLVIDDDDNLVVTTDEWTSPYGIFKDFYGLFQQFNVNDNFTVENLTSDGDLIDEENVYINIKSIPPNTSVSIKLPYRSVTEKTVFLQYLLFEQPQPIFNIGSCKNATQSNKDMIKLSVIDSMQTELEIDGYTDLLSPNPAYPCPDECYTTTEHSDDDITTGGITYRITNVDTNNFSNQTIQTKILNSNEIEPYGYYIDDQYYEMSDENNRIKWTQEEVSTPTTLSGQLIYAYVKFPTSEEETLILRTNSQGIAEFFIPIPSELNRSYTVEELLNSVVYFKFQGKDNYDASIKGFNPNATSILHDNDKTETFLTINDNYQRYHPGQIACIPVLLTAKIKTMINQIVFNAKLGDTGTSDKVTILYRICNIHNNEGIFKTTFQTNDKLLIPNKVSKKIYCGMDTDVDIDAKIHKEIVESKHLNVFYINVKNKNKYNKSVSIDMNLGKIEEQDYYGDYSFIDINIDHGDYAITESSGDIIITWLIGDMEEYQINKGIIKIQAEHTGISDIQIDAFDYLHNKDTNISTPPIKESRCPKCPTSPTYKLTNPKWVKIDQIWYKKIGNKYSRRIIENGVIKWVDKQ